MIEGLQDTPSYLSWFHPFFRIDMRLHDIYTLDSLIQQVEDSELQDAMQVALHSLIMEACRGQMEELGILFEYEGAVH